MTNDRAELQSGIHCPLPAGNNLHYGAGFRQSNIVLRYSLKKVKHRIGRAAFEPAGHISIPEGHQHEGIA